MGKLKEKAKNQSICIRNKLDKFERMNMDEFRRVINGEIEGIVPVQVTTKRSKCVLSVKLDNKIRLKDYLRDSMDTDAFLTVISSTLKVALECERRGLCLESLCWNERYVYIDLNDGRITMLYWPVVRLERPDKDILNFYCGLIDYMKRDAVDSTVLNAYATYFYQRDSINLCSFQTMFRKIEKEWERRKQPETMEIRDDLRPANYIYGKQKNQDRGNVWVESDNGQKKIWLDGKTIVFGRIKNSCDVIINDDNSVSRCHARVQYRDGGYYLEDLESRNGTYLDGQRLQQQTQVKLKEGAQIRLGNSCFTFREREDEGTVLINYNRGGRT